MRKYIVSAAAVAAAMALTTAAQAAPSASSDITITGVAESVCNIPSAPAPSANTNFTVGASTAAATALTVTDFINDTTALANAAAITLTFGSAMCNYAHVLDLRTLNGGLLNAAPPAIVAGTFLDRVDYSASATFGGTTANLTTDGTAGLTNGGQAVAGANIGNLVLTITISAGATPVLVGTYTDTLRVQIGAAI